MNNQQFQDWLQPASPVFDSLPRKTLLMGILNITPDSFSDGGRYFSLAEAWSHAKALIEMGVDIIDIGGESSKPGALTISSDEEISRVLPIINKIRQESDICLAIDTCKAEVMKTAIQAGANLINDIKALRGENALTIAAALKVPVCLMHMQGTPTTMQDNPHYQQPIIDEIDQFFQQRINACLTAGIKREQLILDPGFGFGKSVAHNLSLIKRIARFHHYQLPLLLGVSRKSTLGVITNKAVNERLYAGIAVAVFASMKNVAIIRTHDLHETRQALQMLEAIKQAD